MKTLAKVQNSAVINTFKYQKSKDNLPEATVYAYDGSGDQGEIFSSRPKEKLDDKETIKQLFSKLSSSDQEGLMSDLSSMALSVQQVAVVDGGAPQWADRTTGREVSPVDWIRLHYGSVLGDGSWNTDGLTRADINQADRKLYIAYAKWIKRHPQDELPLPTVARATVADPEETLERHRAASRRTYHKSKLLP